MRDGIFVIMETKGCATKISEHVEELIKADPSFQETKKQAPLVSPFGVEDIRALLQDEKATGLSEELLAAPRKLLIAMDTVGNDFLSNLSIEIGSSPVKELAMRERKISVMPMAAIIGMYCQRHNAQRIWMQKPLIEPCFDEKLPQRLADCGFEVCQIDAAIESVSEYCACSVNDLLSSLQKDKSKSDEAKERQILEATKVFWVTLREEFDKSGVEMAIIIGNMLPLTLYRDPNDEYPPAIDAGMLYAQAILTWASGDY